MATFNITLGTPVELNILVGHQDENEVTEVVFDYSAWKTEFGSGTLALSVQRSADSWPYAVTMTDNGDDTATWDVSDTDTAYKGVGRVQLTYTVGDVRKKSVLYRFTVYESLGAEGNVITPVQLESLIEDVEQLQAEVAALENKQLSDNIKQALLDCFEHVAWIDENGQDYYDALEAALYPPANLVSITAVYTQSGTVYDTDALDDLKPDLVVTASYDDSTTETVTTYTLSGTLTVGTSTITVSYGGKTDTFAVTVSTLGTNYADDLANFSHGTTPTYTYTNGTITMECNQSKADGFNMFAFDSSKTKWDDVVGKSLNVKVTMDSPNWAGEIATTSPRNCVTIGVAIYSQAGATSGNQRQRYETLGQVALTSTSQTFEYAFSADISSFSGGSGTPTSASTFGVFVYDNTVNTVNITNVEVREA